MHPSEIKAQVENDLPAGFKIDSLTYYSLSFIYTDSSDDECEISIDTHGEITTREREDSFGVKNGTSLSADVIMFLWRLSRMAQDKPW